MSEQWVPKKPNFGPPPPGYVAGLGRGATGFITRTDIGPAKQANQQVKSSEVDEAAFSDSKYDSWHGYKGSLFDKRGVDEEDRQAEEAYDFCERKIDERRYKQREERVKKEMEEYEKTKKNLPISEQFVDLKRDLATITEEQWENIPEAKDYSIEKRKRDRYVPVPDSMLVSFLGNTSVNKSEANETANDFRVAQQVLLNNNLDQAENQVEKKKGFDKIGYLTELNLSRADQEIIGDIKRARLLHQSAIRSNPKNPDIWLSAARIEEYDGKIENCREVLRNALKACSDNEDIWIELARVEKSTESKNVLMEALRTLPLSEKIWLILADVQSSNKQTKSKILRKGLENLPKSIKLWKQLIQLEDVEEAKKLLAKAVECLPQQIELWVGLAKLESYDRAKLVLNKARKANPLSLQIWISAAKLQQTQNENKNESLKKIQTILVKGRQILKKNGNVKSRQEWIQEALNCERANNLLTCESIIKISISLGLTKEQFDNVIYKDVQLYENQYQAYYTTRFLYKYGILQTKSIQLFQRMLQFQKRHEKNSKQSHRKETMEFGIKLFPSQVSFWLHIINRFIQIEDYEEGISLIEKATYEMQKKDREQIQLKKGEIYKKMGKNLQARIQLETLHGLYPHSESTYYLISFLYFEKNYERAWSLCESEFKINKSEKMWILASKITKQVHDYKECRTFFSKAVSEFPASSQLWILFIDLEISHNFVNRARAIITEALMKNKKNQQLYIKYIQLEMEHGTKKQISSSLQKALKQCPKSGYLWGIAIELEPHNTRKIKATAALKNFQNNQNSEVSCSVAKVFWKQNKIQKAKKWLVEGIKHDLSNGDLWGYYFMLLREKYPQQLESGELKFKEVNRIERGRKWRQIQKQGLWEKNEQIMGKLLIKIKNDVNKLN